MPLPAGLQGVGYSNEDLQDRTVPDTEPNADLAGDDIRYNVISVSGSTQAIAAGGGFITWDAISTEMINQKGFSDVTVPTTGITFDFDGYLTLDLLAYWQHYRGGGHVVLTLIGADGVDSYRAYDGGLVKSRTLGGTAFGLWVESGDELKVELPNESGDSQNLLAAEMSIIQHIVMSG